MQTPQGLDAQHGGELFPVEESRGTPTRMGLGLFVWDARASPERSAGRFLVREGVDAVSPLDAAKPASPQTQEKLGAEGTGVEILVARHSPSSPTQNGQRATARHSPSSPTQNGQRATMQTPQGFDATHGGELFPIDESRLTSTRMGLGLAG